MATDNYLISVGRGGGFKGKSKEPIRRGMKPVHNITRKKINNLLTRKKKGLGGVRKRIGAWLVPAQKKEGKKLRKHYVGVQGKRKKRIRQGDHKIKEANGTTMPFLRKRRGPSKKKGGVSKKGGGWGSDYPLLPKKESNKTKNPCKQHKKKKKKQQKHQWWGVR